MNSLERYYADPSYRERQKAQKRERYQDKNSPYYQYVKSQNKKNSRRTVLAKYRLTEQEYGNWFAHQGGLCAICREAAASCVDHDHETGAVRGLLCSPCNLGLGHFKDDSAKLIAALAYLSGRK